LILTKIDFVLSFLGHQNEENVMGDPMTRLLELDTRHGELLDRLAELDQLINEVLDDWAKSKELFPTEQPKQPKEKREIEPEISLAAA
jgi:hypothetical protein